MLDRIPLSYYAFSGLLNFATSFALLIFVLFKNPKSRTNQSFSLFAFSVAGWSLCYFLWTTTGKSNLADVYLRTLMLFVIFIPSTFTHFILTFLKANTKFDKRIILGNYLISFLLGLTVYTQWFAKDIGPFLVFPYWLKPRLLFYVHAVHFFANVIYAHFLMFRSLKREVGVFRNQILYVLIGTAIGYTGGAINYLTWSRVPIPPFLNPLVSVYVASVCYAIIKYRLMDIGIASIRAVIFTVIYALVLGFPFLLGYKYGLWQIATWLMLFLATLGPFTYLYIQRRAEDRYFKKQRHNHTILTTAARGITLVRSINKLLNLIVRILTRTLGITHASIFLLDRSTDQYTFRVTRGGKKTDEKVDSGNSLVKYLLNTKNPLMFEEIKRQYDDRRDVFLKEIRDTMYRIDANVLVPSYIEDSLIGFLVLGPKRSGDLYSDEDLNVLSNLANQSALAIENAQFIREREEMQSKLREIETLAVIRDLLGSLHHELYNLLTQAVPMLELIGMGGYDNKPEKLKDDSKKAREKLLFIRTILGWIKEYEEKSRIDKITAHRISDLVDAAMAYLKDNIEKQKIKIETKIDPGLFIIGHESLPLLFKHIAINSVYGYGMENGGVLRIEASIREGDSTVEIIQTDTGHDLNEQINDGKTMGGKMFAEKGKIGGPSYFIAQAIVTQHKGSLQVESMGGNGTKFKVLLPLDINRIKA